MESGAGSHFSLNRAGHNTLGLLSVMGSAYAWLGMRVRRLRCSVKGAGFS